MQRSSPAASAATSHTSFDGQTSMREKFSRVLRWCSASAAVALALAGCGGGGGGEPVNPTTSAPAQLDQVAALTLAQQSVNARMATLRRPVVAAAVSGGTATENFESGMADWSNWGNAQVVPGTGTSGSNAMQVGTGAGGAGLSVPGIVPGTTYRLTAQLKVTDPSDPVFIGINMQDSSGAQVIGHSSPAITSTGYATITVDLVAPANSANAVVWIWKNAGSGYAYLDDVSFGPPTSPPPPPATAPGTNLVSNGGFESGMANWVDWGNTSVVSGQSNSGASALSVGSAAGGAGQSVGGITAGTVYRLVAQAKVSEPSETVFVGVNLLNQAGAAVAQMALPVSSTTYSTVSLDITAPADAVSAVVYVWKNAGSGFGYVDDVVFGAAPGAAPPPPPASAWRNLVANGGFEDGLADWVNWGNSTTSTDAAAGSSAAQVGTAAGGFGQTLGGIVPGTAYSLSAQVKVSIPIELGYLGLKFMDDAGNVLAMKYVTFSSTAYSTAQVHLAAPANATKALVYVWKDAGYGFASIDQVALAQQVTGTSRSPEQVGTTGTDYGFQLREVAQLANGGHVIVWASGTSPANPNSVVQAQLFDANGQKQGGPITVFAAPPGSTIGFSTGGVAALPDGSFLVSGNRSPAYTSGFSGLFVQKVSATGQLLASGGVSDPSVNGGLADRVLFDTDFNTLGFSGGQFFVNPDGSYAVVFRKTIRSAPGTATYSLLLNVDAAGNAIGAPVDLGSRDYFSGAAVVRLTGGNFMVAGTSTSFPGASAAIKIVTNTGQEIGRQTVEPVNVTPAIAPLADGTGMVAWYTSQPQPGGYRGERIDASGKVVALAAVSGQYGGVTGLPAGGYVFTWTSGVRVIGQYFTTSGQVASEAFVVVDNLDTTSTPYATYMISSTPDGFSIVYRASTASGPQVLEVRTSVPALN